jgi:prepilin-type N-terminal cleavage/methylation domain-containing protein
MQSRHGFTIIELLIVITIMLMLLAAASLGIYNARRSSRDTRRMADGLLIGRSIDSYTGLNRGALPIGTGTNRSTMCANTLAGLDTSLLSATGAIPKDPSPVSSSAICSSMLNGYTYHTEYGHLSSPNLASVQKVTYSLEIGLENAKPNSESTYQAPTEIGSAVSSSYPDIVGTGTNTRHRYIINGRSCGTSCYN